MSQHARFAGLLSILSLLCAAQAVPAADLYKIDPVHTSVVFSVAHVGLSYTYGFFRKAGGNYILDETNPTNNRFQFIIQTESLDTNNAERDDHLRGADFFNAQQFPEITFESTSCARINSPDNVVFQVAGNLTIHGVTRPITIPLRMLGKGPGARKDPRTGFLCQIELKRSDYGMSNLLKDNMVGDAVGLTVSFEGSLQEQAGAGPGIGNPRP